MSWERFRVVAKAEISLGPRLYSQKAWLEQGKVNRAANP